VVTTVVVTCNPAISKLGDGGKPAELLDRSRERSCLSATTQGAYPYEFDELPSTIVDIMDALRGGREQRRERIGFASARG
jgi:hypothetical protein